MRLYTVNATAGNYVNVPLQGKYFRVLSATGTIRIEFDNGIATDFLSGLGFASPGGFNGFMVMSPITQDILLAVSELPIDDNRLTASVTSMPPVTVERMPTATMTHTSATVTNASAQLIAANTGRKYMLVQNRDTAGNLYLNLAGAAATTANGIKVGPGESFVLEGSAISTAAVFAIGDIASNANILVVEGA